ncbi:MAG TPA: hypothetical protein ENN64_00960 [bacterium]|nr:hypothetical protein [bacterium]
MDTERGRLLFGRDFSTPEREFVASASGHHPFCVVIPQHGGSVIAADLDCTLIDTDPAAGFPSLEYALSQTLDLLEGNRHWRNLNDWYEANIRGMDLLLRQQLFEGAMEASSGQTDALFLLNIFRHYDGGLLESEYQFLLDMLAKFRRDYA